jgi:hypothetical protein
LGNPIVNISEKFGMKSWGDASFVSLAPFDPVDNTMSFVTTADRTEDHVYFGNDIYSLCLNEQQGYFEGFYSYENCPWRFNYLDGFLTVKGRGEPDAPLADIYLDHAGLPGHFFGEYKPSWITYLLNPDPLFDKIWDTMQYRGHRFDEHGEQIPARTIDWIEVWNDYQHNLVSYPELLGSFGVVGLLPSMLHLGHHKFQAWNLPFPRSGGSLDRVRSPWCYLKLVFDNDEDGGRMEMHDLTILYTV